MAIGALEAVKKSPGWGEEEDGKTSDESEQEDDCVVDEGVYDLHANIISRKLAAENSHSLKTVDLI